MNDNHAHLTIKDQTCDLPILVGTENEVAVDISKLRAQTKTITLDSGFGNTGSCQSSVTFIDGENGILRYRGYPIEQLAEKSSFVEVAYLLIFGELPTAAQLDEFRNLLAENAFVHQGMMHHFEGFPEGAHPMAVLSAMINAVGCYDPKFSEAKQGREAANILVPAAKLMSKIRTIVAAAYKKSRGESVEYPRPDLSYTKNFLHLMFSRPHNLYQPTPEVAKALEQLLILHADHEQNCSTSTVRMVASAQANLYASIASGVCALWGPLHGGANQRVIQMLSEIRESGESTEAYVAKVKDKKNKTRLMGFGHRVYKSFDPRARIIKQSCDEVLQQLHVEDPLLEIALKLEETALHDEYFIERKLYPNVDFYSGIILRAIGIPQNMFTVMFAIGRLPGWIAQYREVATDPHGHIYRPRQLYMGATVRDYVPMDQRG